MERPGLFKSISAVFVFILLFFGVSNALGGGAVGVGAAAATALIVAVGYFLFYGWIVRLPPVRRWMNPERRSPGTPVTPAPSQRGPEAPAVRPAADAEPRSRADAERPRKSPARSRPRRDARPPEPDMTAMLTRGARNVCDPGPYDVEPGRPVKIALNVDRSCSML